MRIAILGTRGIPASYGGFETGGASCDTTQARGHEVTVIAARTTFRRDSYIGVRLKVPPTIRHKYFDTVVHTFSLRNPRRFGTIRCRADLQLCQRSCLVRSSGLPEHLWRSMSTGLSINGRNGAGSAPVLPFC